MALGSADTALGASEPVGRPAAAAQGDESLEQQALSAVTSNALQQIAFAA
jgi:hypothetical protein